MPETSPLLLRASDTSPFSPLSLTLSVSLSYERTHERTYDRRTDRFVVSLLEAEFFVADLVPSTEDIIGLYLRVRNDWKREHRRESWRPSSRLSLNRAVRSILVATFLSTASRRFDFTRHRGNLHVLLRCDRRILRRRGNVSPDVGSRIRSILRADSEDTRGKYKGVELQAIVTSRSASNWIYRETHRALRPLIER